LETQIISQRKRKKERKKERKNRKKKNPTNLIFDLKLQQVDCHIEEPKKHYKTK